MRCRPRLLTRHSERYHHEIGAHAGELGIDVLITVGELALPYTETFTDGETYPVVDVEISSESHPFYTGKARTVDSEGRIARFERRFGGGEQGPGTEENA